SARWPGSARGSFEEARASRWPGLPQRPERSAQAPVHVPSILKTTCSEEQRGKTMHEITQLADRYVAIWHEPDAEQRRRSVAQLWAEDGVQFTAWGEMRGHQALEKRIEAAYQEFVKTRGLLWRRAGDVHGHHDALKFTWEMVLAVGGDVPATGTIF